MAQRVQLHQGFARSSRRSDGCRSSRSPAPPPLLRFWNDEVIRDLDNVCQHIVIEAGLDGR
ncbi:MAG: hypothetical protein EOQ42_04015 [Mesorhizobium sp.]|nr:MAG: hypothetical protein EOQ43_09880 [Mesorhizobium sp.]TGU00959.1 hypothetical protein EN807_14675 [Mesorhizobium sp. M5C.F.Ca.ET.164.01.1.1]RWB80688.1 MAG: hypothetical protein EOQ42_04015 [Mesorhizobium sp.]RWC08098.1 MAG: hypothetical protein EOS51_26295 [Mesorhizobium sp.]RWD20980.1 MAG: hypothetical protein EOS57_07380 [Mesorhizobium sp.]